MNATSKRSGVDIRVIAIAVIVLLLAFGGAAAWAYSTNADLERTRQTVTSTSTDLDATKKTLADTDGKVTLAKATRLTKRPRSRATRRASRTSEIRSSGGTPASSLRRRT